MKVNLEEQRTRRWNEWFVLYHKAVHGYLFALTQNVHLTDDLTQETFTKAWEFRENYEERGTPQAFLFRIASHCLKDFFRKRQETLYDEETWSVIDPASQQPSPDEQFELSEESVRLRETMKKLSPVQRDILSLRYFSELKFSEIAEVLEIPLNTVLSHAHRGLAALREKMGANQENGSESGK